MGGYGHTPMALCGGSSTNQLRAPTLNSYGLWHHTHSYMWLVGEAQGPGKTRGLGEDQGTRKDQRNASVQDGP